MMALIPTVAFITSVVPAPRLSATPGALVVGTLAMDSAAFLVEHPVEALTFSRSHNTIRTGPCFIAFDTLLATLETRRLSAR